MDSVRKYKHAILLIALVGVALVESFSHRQVLGSVLSDGHPYNDVARFPDRLRSAVEPVVALFAFTIVVSVNVAHYVPSSFAELPLRLIFHSATLLLVGFAALVILRNIFEQHVVRTDDVLGAVRLSARSRSISFRAWPLSAIRRSQAMRNR
jgi:hypothetical protein